MLTIEPRLRAAAKQHRSKSVVRDLSSKLHSSQRKKQDAEREIAWCEGFLEFQNRNIVIEYPGSFRVFEIEDGETHMVAANNQHQALLFYAVEISGYDSIEQYELDVCDVEVREQLGETVVPVWDEETGKLIVKTAAEWADVELVTFISTTCF